MQNKTLHILLVDDQESIIAALKKLLSQAKRGNYITESVNSLSSALDILGKTNFDAILLDLNLPDSNNLSTMNTIIQSYPAIPVIVITGMSGEETGIKAIAEGAQDYLVKGDFDENTLEKSIAFAIERKNASISLLCKERELRMLIENGLDFICIIDTDGIVLYASPSVKKQLGYDPIELIGEHFFSIVHIDDQKKMMENYQQMIENKYNHLIKEYRLKQKSGLWRIFESRFSPKYGNNNELLCIILNSNDITERKNAEAELLKHQDNLEVMIRTRTAELMRAKDSVEKASRARSEFIANISHELRTPLNSIIGFTKLMKMGYSEENYNDYLSNIDNSGIKLLELINNILDLIKLDTGKMTFDKKHVCIDTIIRSSIDITREKYPDINRKIEFISNSINSLVNGDENRLKQMFIHLLSNAVKFTGDNGLIRIISRSINDNIEIQVTDDGIGIKKSLLNKIFEEFYMGESGLTREKQGAGIGLSIVKKIIDAHEGTIFVKSEEGAGTTITISMKDVKEHIGHKTATPCSV